MDVLTTVAGVLGLLIGLVAASMLVLGLASRQHVRAASIRLVAGAEALLSAVADQPRNQNQDRSRG